ncbi:GTPase domain-containing protein [bacterium]|nr:GTPase domain-containing protein [bacterium]
MTQIRAIEPEAPRASGWETALVAGMPVLEELLAARVPDEAARKAEALLGLSYVLLFRFRTGNRLPIVGLMGSADSGKSTLFNSIVGREISRVTPIPHQTTGAIVAAPEAFEAASRDPAFLRPTVTRVDPRKPDVTGLTGRPGDAIAVFPATGRDLPFVLIDLPDVGTLDSAEERQVALRLMPWLDRIVLLVTEESFAQAEHEQIAHGLSIVRPERARAELFVVLNRRYAHTSDEEFAARVDAVRALWRDATISRLPNLARGTRFPGEAWAPLVAESHARVGRVVQSALRNLAAELADDVRAIAQDRVNEQRMIGEMIETEIRGASRFRKAFLADEFRARLDDFSPWKTSVARVRGFLGLGRLEEPKLDVDMLSADAVTRHVANTADELRRALVAQRARASRVGSGVPYADLASAPVWRVAEVDDAAMAAEIARLVARVNDEARREVEDMLATLRVSGVKHPVWGSVAAGASALFVLDLFVPGVGTGSTLAVSGLLSMLGIGGMVRAEVMRRMRESRVRAHFEDGLADVLRRRVRLLPEEPAMLIDLSDHAARLGDWAQGLPEVL